MHSDAFGCVRMRSDAVRSVKQNFDFVERTLEVFAGVFPDVFGRFRRFSEV